MPASTTKLDVVVDYGRPTAATQIPVFSCRHDPKGILSTRLMVFPSTQQSFPPQRSMALLPPLVIVVVNDPGILRIGAIPIFSPF